MAQAAVIVFFQHVRAPSMVMGKPKGNDTPSPSGGGVGGDLIADGNQPARKTTHPPGRVVVVVTVARIGCIPIRYARPGRLSSASIATRFIPLLQFFPDAFRSFP